MVSHDKKSPENREKPVETESRIAPPASSRTPERSDSSRSNKIPPRKVKFTSHALFQMFGPFRETVQKDGVRLLKVLLASLFAAIAVNLFLKPSGMLVSGFGGVSLLIQRVCQTFFGVNVSFSLLNLLLNVPPALIAFFIVGKKFLWFSVIYIISFSVLVDILPIHPIVDDLVLCAIVAAVLNGTAAAIALNANASGGGTDFIAMIASSKFNIATWNYVFLFNACVLALSGFLFGWRPAMYSMIFQFLSTQIVNRLHARYQRKTLFIITNEKEPIASDLLQLTHHGVTLFEGIGRYSQQRRYLIYMVVSKNDVPVIRKYLRHSKQQVFLNIADSEELDGRFYLEPID